MTGTSHINTFAACAVILAFLVGCAQGETVMHVRGQTPNAKFMGEGTEESPWRSIHAAMAAVRDLTGAGLTQDLRIVLHSGVYRIWEPLEFGPEHGGTQQFSVTWCAAPGEDVVISGGREITGWQAGPDGIWTATVPGVREGEWYPSSLIIDGQPATRARTPNANAPQPLVQIADEQLDPERMEFRLTFPAGLVESWNNPTDVEMVCQGNWAINRKRVVSLEPDSNAAVFQPPHLDRSKLAWNWPGRGRWFFLENAREFLDQPGEWYLDRASGTLSYLPLPGQDMSEASAVMPRCEGLLVVKGTDEQPVRNLHFQGIQFEGSAWPLPRGDYHGVQACRHSTGGDTNWKVVPVGIRWECAQDCSLTEGAVRHFEASGLEIGRRCHDVRVVGNEISDIGGNGIEVGAANDDAEAPAGNVVSDNHVHHTGQRFFGAVGIWVGFARETTVSHNRVHDLPYSGISCGWVWAPQASACKANLIEYNHIHHVMGKLCDGGGIYTLGLQPGTVIRGNLIHDVYRSGHAQGAPNNGMFIDEGSTGFLFERNVIYAVGSEPVRHNQNRPEGHTWVDNQFGIQAFADGIVGSALQCPSALVETPHSEALEPEQLTLEAWVRVPASHSGGDTRRWIVCKNDDEWTQGNYALVTNVDKVGAYLNIGGGQGNMIALWSGEGALVPDVWQHVAMTYNGKDLVVFANGTEVARRPVNRRREPGNTPLAVGGRQDRYSSFEGLIDEVRVYSRALPQEELAAHVAQGAADPPVACDPAQEIGLIAYFGFDEGNDARRIIEQARANTGPREPHRSRLGVQ